ncbi:CBL-interacting protein kinase 31 [Gracilariopsis chorda]|uniref:CBL-interacting protein kinase 31 n=1 Tax=Gracilariopsis chorda TaxID=448386 RepID=A0A2V3IUA3_9FLOR|nr:CBL-interacting protein kinase 31 [Gracilariopsis chorda]|eukprot:PXF45704.1 CBL-interacting protein kinase 31 [Gracilariopsis chorda]
MGNANSASPRPSVPDDALNIFNQLDVERKGYLTLKDFIDRPHPDFTTPRSLPAIFFFDQDKDGTLTADEFRHLLRFLQNERHNLETSMKHDKPLRDLIYKASLAGVKDCSVHGRSSYRRFSSFRNVRSVYSSRSESTGVQPSSSDVPPPYPTDASAHLSTSPSDHSHNVPSRSSIDSAAANPRPEPHQHSQPHPHSSAESSLSTETDDHHDDYQPAPNRIASVSMFSSQREFECVPARLANPSKSDSELSLPETDQDPRNRTALDAAVLEKIMHANIHKLADSLHEEGYREQFMAWLWRLSDYNNAGVVTIDELRVFLEALKEDSIDLHELVFYRVPQATLEQSIINEFDTTHAGRLCRDEFMVLADLVTREYEFWENRHLERVGDYELGRTIGRGSSGVVRYATHVETREKVAMKIIKKGKCSDLSRLDREIQSLMAAKHKNIVALHEVLESENNLHIVMELCGGGSMVDIVRLYPEERMPEETARFFIRQGIEALSYCHEIGICHRDVRLDNLMLDNAGNMKITDFGHSGMFTPGWDMFSSALVGSVFNLSPEQIMGHVYSGEKIDIWSAGVAVYCLLVGRPPFYEPEVNALLERILTCDFEIPDFLSASAGDFIRCMIRAVPAERIPLHQMLHHPWFYDGPEFGPSMNVVAIPVDKFFVKRPDIAEMIMAMTIYQHHLHFHLADTQNPRAAPQTLRGQEWTLKCLCPKNDIKFTVSLFTRKPELCRRRKKNVQLTSPVSLSTLTEPGVLKEIVFENPRSRIENPLVRKRSDHAIELSRRASLDLEGSPPNEMATLPKTPSESFSGGSPTSPQYRRRAFQITPMDIAAQLRQTGGIDFSSMGFGEILDFDNETNPVHFPSRTFRDDMLSGNDVESTAIGVAEDSKRICGHSRWRSFEARNGNLRRLNRSATVDAFPYQKVYPKRKMPESARKLNFDRPHSPAPEALDQGDSESEQESFHLAHEDNDSSRLESTVRSRTTQRYSMEETSSRLSGSASLTDQEIAQKLCRHPLKAKSPQSPQISRITCTSSDWPIDSSEPDSKQAQEAVDSQERHDVGSSGAGAGPSDISVEKVELKGQVSSLRPPQDDFQPYIEVRLQDGESGLFLKICRTLKAICTTKLKAAAEQKKVRRRNSRRSLSALRRTASGRSVESDVTVD